MTRLKKADLAKSEDEMRQAIFDMLGVRWKKQEKKIILVDLSDNEILSVSAKLMRDSENAAFLLSIGSLLEIMISAIVKEAKHKSIAQELPA